tara:strand:- start:36702 stop:37295 length:594 start_codon:yes stop_codon:yes gene_type:complete
MALDFDNIYGALSTSISNSIGSRLSQISPPSGSPYPAIIRARQDGQRPDQHFVTVDIENAVPISTNGLLTQVDSDTGEVCYTLLYEVFVALKCFGDNALSILQEYQTNFMIDDGVRYQLQADAGLASHKLGNVKSIPDFLQTNHEERSLLRMSFYVHDTITKGTYLAVINGQGEYKEGSNVVKTSTIEVDASQELNP